MNERECAESLKAKKYLSLFLPCWLLVIDNKPTLYPDNPFFILHFQCPGVSEPWCFAETHEWRTQGSIIGAAIIIEGKLRSCRSAAESVVAIFAPATNRITVVVGGDTNNGFAESICCWGQTGQTSPFHWSQSSPDMILCIVPQNFKALTIFSFFIANFAFHRM